MTTITLPGEKDLASLPRWGRVALAARTARRAQPLVQACWPGVPAKYLGAIDAAISEGEIAATAGKPTASARSAGMGAMDVYGSEPLGDTQPAAFIAFGASRVAFAISQRDAGDAAFAIEEIGHAVYWYQRNNKLRGLTTVFKNAVWHDYKCVASVAKQLKLNNSSAFSPSTFGTLWPKGDPKGWPTTDSKSPIPQRRRRRSTNKKALAALPASVHTFLAENPNHKIKSRSLECGTVELKTLDLLEIDRFIITTNGTPEAENDPNQGKDGGYILNVVDLVSDCENYDPEGILTWFLDYDCFGCYDTDHGTAKMFLADSWDDIIAKPVPYLNSQWNLSRRHATFLVSPWTSLKWCHG